MPRTIFRPDLSSADDAQRVRSSIECSHRREQEWTFLHPFWIGARPTGESTEENVQVNTQGNTQRTTQGNNTEGLWGWQHHYWMDVTFEKLPDNLVAEDYRRFCFKDCALYTPWTIVWLRRQLFDRIYRRWYPSRAEDVDISHGAFFCSLVSFLSKSATHLVTLKEVLAFHKDLCLRLDRFVPELGPPIPFTAGVGEPTEEGSLLLPRTEYKVRPTFKRCFIHLHAEWSDHSIDSKVMKKRGVRVVFVEEADAASHGCTEDIQEGITRRREEEQGLEGAAVFRCDTIERAMRVILATDPRRIEGRKESHGHYEVADEILDSSPDATVPEQPCLCRPCVERVKQDSE